MKYYQAHNNCCGGDAWYAFDGDEIIELFKDCELGNRIKDGGEPAEDYPMTSPKEISKEEYDHETSFLRRGVSQ